MLDNMSEYDLDPELCECTRIISNNFVINSAGISPATRQRQQRARGMQRRQNANPQAVNFDLKCDSPEKDSNSMSEDISFYSSNARVASPEPCPISPCRTDTEMSLLSPGTSPSLFSIDTIQPRIERQDSSSMDSGYSGNSNRASATSTSFQFVEPKRPESTRTPSRVFSAFHSLSSGSGNDSNDDDYLDLMDMESIDDENVPNDLSSLICKTIKSASKTPEHKTPVRKCLNMDGSLVKSSLFDSPKTSSTISSLITTPERQCLQSLSENVTPFGHRNITTGAFKRPEPPTMSPVQSKRYKSENEPPVMAQQFVTRPVLRKSMSMNDANIMSALSRSSADSNLIGDFSQPHALPLIEGRHTDLKSISAETMRKLLQGDFVDRVASYKIIDCRYPYEFEGGHIRGAVNLFMHDQILEEFGKKTETPVDGKRNILIFHCEFSSERGPKLSRFLRQHDRTINTLMYPALNYPEVYLLHGGYKDFFEHNSDMCSPATYRPMLEPSFTNEYKLFRAKTKSWSGDTRSTAARLTKSRSRLVL